MAGRFDPYEIASPDMNSVLSDCLHIHSTDRAPVLGWASVFPIAKKLSRVLHQVAKVISIPALALAIIVGIFETIMTPGLELLLQASLFVSGFVFLALAVDSEKASTGWLLAATGIALPTLTYLSIGGSRLFTAMAAALVAFWVITAIQRGK